MQLSSSPKVQSFIVTEEQKDDYKLIRRGFCRSFHNFDYILGGELSLLAFLDAGSLYAGSSPNAMNGVRRCIFNQGMVIAYYIGTEFENESCHFNSIASVIDNASSSTLTKGECR